MPTTGNEAEKDGGDGKCDERMDTEPGIRMISPITEISA